MKIVALSLSPMSGVQKARLEALGELDYHDVDLGDPSQVEVARGADILVVTPRPPGDVTPHLDGCRLVSVQGTGVDQFKLDVLRERGVRLSNVPDALGEACAEHAFAMLLGAAKKLALGREILRDGAWVDIPAYFTLGLSGKTLGLLGYGSIGARVGRMAKGFGMHVIACVRNPAKARDVETVGFEELLGRSDGGIVLAAPATAETADLFNAAAFEKMQPTAVLVNVARGALVVDADVVAALDAGRIAGYATDVFRKEPPPADHPLVRHPKVLANPHVAWATPETVRGTLDTAIENVEAYLAGRPQNVVV